MILAGRGRPRPEETFREFFTSSTAEPAERTVTTQAANSDIPRTGMLATVRNRTGVIAAVEPFDGDDGRIHLVHLEYQDEHAPGQERLLWELEPERKLQGRLFNETERLEEVERSIEEREKELKRRRSHYEEIREQLGRERTRILDRLLPARFTLAGEAQVFPVAVELRLPERSFYGRPESAPA